MYKLFIIYLSIISIYYSQDLILIGDSNLNNLEVISESLADMEIYPRIWDNLTDFELSDSLLSIQRSIILWEMSTMPSDVILTHIESVLNNENSIAIFSDSVFYDNSEYFADIFGSISIREVYTENIYQLENPENSWNLNDNISVTELGWIGSAIPIMGYTEEGEYAVVCKDYNLGKTLASGFYLEDVEDLIGLLNELLIYLLYNPYEIEIGKINAFPGDTIYIPITTYVEESIIGLSIVIQSHPEDVQFLSMQQHHQLENFVWEINQLPFGIVEINGAAEFGNLPEGEMEIGSLQAWLYPSSSDKIGLHGLENQLVHESGLTTTAIMKNGEIDVLFDYSIVELIPPSLIEPSTSGIVDVNLITEHELIAFQFCLEYDMEILGINNVESTDRIPNSWWVSFVNHPESNNSEIFCFGFDPISPGSEPILELTFNTYTDIPQEIEIEFCDALLVGTDSENVNNNSVGTNLIIDNPKIIVNPQSIITDGNLDLLFQVSQNQNFNGFQFDLGYPEELTLDNIIIGNMLYEPTGGWSSISAQSIRVLYFHLEEFISQPRNGLFLTASFTVSDIVELDLFEFSINNTIVTNLDIELIPIKFLDFEIENNLSLEGDVNGDNSQDIFDIIILLNFILESLEFGPAQETISDINNDGIIDVLDVLLIVNIIIG